MHNGRPNETLNWDRRKFITLGPDFRIDANDPKMGNRGNLSWLIYGVNDDGDKSSMFQNNDGTLSIDSSRKIEIVAGANNENEKEEDISITAVKGGITITCSGNGQVKISASNILLQADEDIDIQAGRNLTLNAKSGTLDINGFKANVSAKLGNLPKGLGIDFAKNAFAGSFVGPDFLESALGGALPQLTDVASSFSGKLESQLKDKLPDLQAGIGNATEGLTDSLNKIDTNALQDQLKGQLSQDSIKNLFGGLG